MAPQPGLPFKGRLAAVRQVLGSWPDFLQSCFSRNFRPGTGAHYLVGQLKVKSTGVSLSARPRGGWHTMDAGNLLVAASGHTWSSWTHGVAYLVLVLNLLVTGEGHFHRKLEKTRAM